MPDFMQSLQGRDLGHLRIIAELWGVEFSAPDAKVGLQRLAPALLERGRVREALQRLPQEARPALDDLLSHDGRLSWPLFTRRYGKVREMGPAKRDRERPFLTPASATEALWYRGLVARAFLEGEGGPEEFAYIPDDLLALLPLPERPPAAPVLGRAASPHERTHLIPASDRILDHACTLLAALRLGYPVAELALPLPGPTRLTPAHLRLLLQAAGLLDETGLPLPEPTRLFLEAGRPEALAQLARAWLQTPLINELRLLPGLSAEGEWQNDPVRTRRTVLGFVSAAGPANASGERPFWSLAAFLTAIRQTHPDFQRPAGDYDSWYLRDEASGEFLRGFEHWDAVDGALVRFTITGPLAWLGVVDLAAPAPEAPASAFRLSAWGEDLLKGAAPAGLRAENETLQARSDGRLFVPRLVPRSARYQLARFGDWGEVKDDVYLYHLTPASLERARLQGLRLSHLMGVLRRHAPGVPPTLTRALERWEEKGVEARLERVVVLRLSRPDLLQALRSSRAARFLGDPLGPTAVIVKPGAWQKVLNVLTEMGYLGEVNLGNDPSGDE